MTDSGNKIIDDIADGITNFAKDVEVAKEVLKCTTDLTKTINAKDVDDLNALKKVTCIVHAKAFCGNPF